MRTVYYNEQLLLSCTNLLFLILTMSKIRKVQKDMNRIMAQDESSKHQNRQQNENEKYGN